MFVLQNSVSGECWEPSTAELPVIKLTCYKDGVKEEITVTEDATGWPFSKVMVNDRLLG